MQLLLCVIAVVGVITWIRKFLDSKRSPAGLAKLTDDDWFRMIFSAFVGVVAVFVVVRGWPGLSSWIINSGSDFWGVLGDKFGDGRGAKPLDAMRPTLTEGRFVNFGDTGLTLTVFYASIFLGLVFYTSAFIAEVVRGGILAVPSGQSEAAAALGLNRAQALRKVVLPQAFRVIMPPLGNQYLNITKNTSLGIAVGFSEIVQVGQTVYNKNSQTLAVFSIYMIFYLSCSLSISSVVNRLTVVSHCGALTDERRDHDSNIAQMMLRDGPPLAMGAGQFVLFVVEHHPDHCVHGDHVGSVEGIAGSGLSEEADWTSVSTNLRLLMIYNYPADQIIRIWVSAAVVLLAAGLSLGGVEGRTRPP